MVTLWGSGELAGGSVPGKDGAAEAAAQPSVEPQPPAGPGPDYKDLFLRAAAELENYRKRVERERQSLLMSASEGVVRRLLEPYDSFGRAIADLVRVQAEAPRELKAALNRTLEGLRALQRQFAELLAAEGVETIDAQGAEFDPAYHEALVRVPHATAPSGTVVEVLQPGYTQRGRLLRPARVAISAGPGEPAPAASADPNFSSPTPKGAGQNHSKP